MESPIFLSIFVVYLNSIVLAKHWRFPKQWKLLYVDLKMVFESRCQNITWFEVGFNSNLPILMTDSGKPFHIWQPSFDRPFYTNLVFSWDFSFLRRVSSKIFAIFERKLREIFRCVCSKQHLIGGSVFPHKRIHRATWVSRTLSQRTRDWPHLYLKEVSKIKQDVRVKRGAVDVTSDHDLVVAKLKLKLRKNGTGQERRCGFPEWRK